MIMVRIYCYKNKLIKQTFPSSVFDVTCVKYGVDGSGFSEFRVIRNFMRKYLYFRGILQNFSLFNYAEFRRNSAEFRIGNLSNKFLQKP
jgi:hypothetical protein